MSYDLRIDPDRVIIPPESITTEIIDGKEVKIIKYPAMVANGYGRQAVIIKPRAYSKSTIFPQSFQSIF